LVVSGVNEFANEFEIETRITLDKILVSNEEDTQDAGVAAWFEERFTGTGFVAAWQAQKIVNRALHRYVAQHPSNLEQN
jgi:myosin-crossreactive antigen